MSVITKSRPYIIKEIIYQGISQTFQGEKNILYRTSLLISGATIKLTFIVPKQENLDRQVHPYHFSTLLQQSINWISYQLGYDEKGVLIQITDQEDEHKLYFSFEINTEYPAPRLDRKIEVENLISRKGVFSHLRIVYRNAVMKLESWKTNKSPDQIYEDKLEAFDKLIDRDADPEILEEIFEIIFRDENVYYARLRRKGEDDAKRS